MDATAHLAAIVRAGDRDRYLADLYAPEPLRRHLLAMHAFDAEVRRIPRLVREPALGEIRLQWWRDVVRGEGEPGGHPVAAALLETVAAFGLPVKALDDLLAARIFDLYSDPMPTMADFEGYAGETVSAVLQLGALILSEGRDPGSADAAGHAGVALALTAALVRFGDDARRHRLFLPLDILGTHGVTTEMVYAARRTDQIDRALADLRGEARRHAGLARAAAAALPPALRPVFLPLALVDADLKRQERVDPFAPARPMPGWRRQLRLWRAARS